MNLVEAEHGDVTATAIANDSMSVGTRLRIAREAQGMAVKDVAEILRFSPRQIEAIEADAYDRLPGPTFVRGLVRGYAKFVRIDGDSLVAHLQSAVPASVSDVRPPSAIADAAEHSPATVVAVSPRVFLAGLVVLAALGTLLYSINAFDVDVVEALTRPSEARVQPPVETVAPTPGVDQSVSPTGPSDPMSASQPAAQVPVVSVAGSSEPDSMAPIALPGLVVEFDDRSWIEVRDATQSVVLSGEFSKGVRQEVAGSAPFQLWIGRASVVRVNFKGAPVDVKARTREDVARLTVE